MMQFGWIFDPAGVMQCVAALPPAFRAWSTCASSLDGTGAGKMTLLYPMLTKVAGRFPLRNQGQIGSCVAVSSAGATDTLQAVQMLLHKQSQGFKLISAEAYYGFSRVEVGGGRLGNGDGSLGAWAATAATKFGCLTEERVGAYSVQRCKEWGVKGVPDEYEPEAKKHTVKSVTRVQGWENARDAITNGYPVTLASNQGFSSQRDGEGFCSPSGQWAHQMYLAAVDEEHSRPGGLIVNSWGPSWVSGPRRHDQPEGTFWADASVIDRMCKSGDCWAYSDFEGFAPRHIDWADAV